MYKHLLRAGLLTALVSPALIVSAQAPATASKDANAPKDANDPVITVSEELIVEERLEGDDPWLAERATTATKIATPRHRTPLSVSAMTARLLEEQDARVLGDALENVPGVTVTRFGGSTDVFVIRGFDSLSSAAVLTDGTLEPEVSLYQIYNLERVEVVRGPSGFLYGGTALAGAVNLVRKRPTFDRGINLDLLVGSHDTVYGRIDIDAPVGARSGFRLNAFGSDSEGYRDGREDSVWAFHPSFRHRISDRTRIDVAFEFEDAELASDGGIPFLIDPLAGPNAVPTLPDIPRTRSFQLPFDMNARENIRVHVDVESILDPRLVVRGKAWWNSLDQASIGTIVNVAVNTPDFGALVLRSINNLDDDQDFYGGRFEALLDVGGRSENDRGGIRHQIVAGLEAQHQTDAFALTLASASPISLFMPIETFDPGTSESFPLAFGDTTVDILAPYVLDTITFGPRVSVALGLRFDGVQTEDAISGADFSDDQLSPFAGLTVAPNDRWTLYASYGESFDPPSVTVVAAEREPEEGRQAEVGVKARFAEGRIQASLAAFHLEKDNIAIPDATGFLAQQGDQESRGVELELVGRTRSGFHWRFAYAHTDAELVRFAEVFFPAGAGRPFIADFSGNQPAWVPENVFDAWAGTRFRSGFGIAGGLRWVDTRFTDEDNQREVDDYLTLDAALSYTRGGIWTARVNLGNLTDEDYELRALSPFAVLPADGFNLQAGIDLQF